jgi:hypothetical protein
MINVEEKIPVLNVLITIQMLPYALRLLIISLIMHTALFATKFDPGKREMNFI